MKEWCRVTVSRACTSCGLSLALGTAALRVSVAGNRWWKDYCPACAAHVFESLAPPIDALPRPQDLAELRTASSAPVLRDRMTALGTVAAAVRRVAPPSKPAPPPKRTVYKGGETVADFKQRQAGLYEKLPRYDR